jgi:lipopolysaccharide transport system permease protein
MEGSQAVTRIAPPAQKRKLQVRRIKASTGLIPVDFRELWDYRSLLYLFTWRDIKTRYRQTYLSGFWAIFRPFTTMVLLTIIFGHVAGIDPGTDVPYALFAYSGVIAWTYFQSAAGSGVFAVASNGGLLGKAYFPRLYAPIAVVTTPLTDFVLAFVVLLGVFGWYHRMPSWHVIFLPAFLLISVFLAMSISLWLSGAAVKYRDIGFGVPFLIQAWMYATPIIYPSSAVPEKYQWLLALNPMTAVIEGFRWALIGSAFPSAQMIGVSLAVTFGLLVPGLYFFRRSERTVVDLM